MTFAGLCASITTPDLRQYEEDVRVAVAQGAKLIEFRKDKLDQNWYADPDYEILTQRAYHLAEELGVETVATCMAKDERIGGFVGTEKARMKLLRTEIDCGADNLTLELVKFAYSAVRDAAKYARDSGTQLIIADHNFDETPSEERIEEKGEEMLSYGADKLKFTYNPENCPEPQSAVNRTLWTITRFSPHDVIALSTGEKGQASRALAPCLGGWTTFAYIDGKQPAGPGQLPLDKLDKWIANLRKLLGTSTDDLQQTLMKDPARWAQVVEVANLARSFVNNGSKGSKA